LLAADPIASASARGEQCVAQRPACAWRRLEL